MKLPSKMLGFFAMFFMLTFSLVSCGGSGGGGSGSPEPITYELTGIPDPSTVFDTIDTTYYYSNNLVNGIWHGP